LVAEILPRLIRLELLPDRQDLFGRSLRAYCHVILLDGRYIFSAGPPDIGR
jgi:hypothetical protein